MVEPVFGPVPSRRLGLSLGVNNIPPKICTYSCIYCQLGRTLTYEVKRRRFYEPKTLVEKVKSALLKTDPDYVTFVPDGEPTLDINLGVEIEEIRELGVKVAVITNGSLLFREDVREDLMEADLVSVKVDAVDPHTYKKVNRPHGSLNLDEILKGMLTFSDQFHGKLLSETMLVKGVNDGDPRPIAEFLSELSPSKAYISIPIRPPAEPWVSPPTEERLLAFYETFKEVVEVELLSYHEEGEFVSRGTDPKRELLSILSVHPMRVDQALKFLKDVELLKDLINSKEVKKVYYLGEEYLVRSLTPRDALGRTS